jgi:hypothetical protein
MHLIDQHTRVHEALHENTIYRRFERTLSFVCCVFRERWASRQVASTR